MPTATVLLLVMRRIAGPPAETFAFKVEKERKGNHGDADTAEQSA